MVYLPLTIFLSTAIVVTFKIFDRMRINSNQAIIVNYIVAILCGYLILGSNLKVSEIFTRSWFPLAVASGTLMIIVFHLFAASTQKAGIVVTAVSSKMSLIIPVSIGLMVYGDRFNIQILIGIILALLAFYFTFTKKGDKTRSKYIYLPLLLFFINGSSDSVFKYAENFYIRGETLMFLTVAFSISFIIGIIIFLFSYFTKKEPFRRKNLYAGIWLGLINWGATYMLLLGLKYYSSVVFFPTMNVSIVLLSAITGYALFKEQLTRTNLMGISLAILAIVLIAFG